MKKFFICICLFSSFFCVFSQDTLVYEKAKSFLKSQSIKLSPADIISIFKESDGSWLKWDDLSDPTPFESAYNLNVFDYFNLNDLYDSELKKDVFKHSSEYKSLRDSLLKIKSDYLTATFYQFGFNTTGGETFTTPGEGWAKNGSIDYRVNYNLKKKGFEIGIGEVLPYHCLRAFCPKVIEDIEFLQLPISKQYNLSQSKKSYSQYLFILIDATKALEMENNRDDINIIRVFNIKGINTANFSDSDFLSENYGKACKVKVVKGGNMRLIIYNKKTNEIYFDKLYTQLQTK